MDRLNLVEAARLLSLDTREVVRRAKRNELPGIERRGHWEFRRQDLRDYLQRVMPEYTDEALSTLDQRLSALDQITEDAVLVPLLHRDTMALPLSARTKAGALRELVALGESVGLVWDGAALLSAIEEREELCPTGVGMGVGLPHPRAIVPYAVAESFIVFGRTTAPFPYGSVDGSMVDLLFLLCSTDESTHLHVLARLCRILREQDTLDFLRAAESADDVIAHLLEREQALLGRR